MEAVLKRVTSADLGHLEALIVIRAYHKALDGVPAVPDTRAENAEAENARLRELLARAREAALREAANVTAPIYDYSQTPENRPIPDMWRNAILAMIPAAMKGGE